MGTVAIFVDGGYLDHVSMDCGSPRIDFARFSEVLAGSDELLRTYYYHCLPYTSEQPTEEELARLEGKKRFFLALTRIGRYEVREGKLELSGNDCTGAPLFQQKRVDTTLGVDMITLAMRGNITRAILISGDSDFVPIVQAVKAQGVLVHLYHGTGENKPHRDLWDAADLRSVINQDLLKDLQLVSNRSQQEESIEYEFALS